MSYLSYCWQLNRLWIYFWFFHLWLILIIIIRVIHAPETCSRNLRINFCDKNMMQVHASFRYKKLSQKRWLTIRGIAINFFGGGYKFSKLIVELFWGGIIIMYIIRSITIKTSFLLHKNLPGLILGGYIYRYTSLVAMALLTINTIDKAGRRTQPTNFKP